MSRSTKHYNLHDILGQCKSHSCNPATFASIWKSHCWLLKYEFQAKFCKTHTAYTYNTCSANPPVPDRAKRWNDRTQPIGSYRIPTFMCCIQRTFKNKQSLHNRDYRIRWVERNTIPLKTPQGKFWQDIFSNSSDQSEPFDQYNRPLC